MLAIDRQNKMLEILNKKKTVTVSEFSKILKVSEATVRRDINNLSNGSRLKKVHGGASFIPQAFYSTKEIGITEKNLINIKAKSKIAKYASSLIQDDDFIFLDAGTTTALICKYLQNQKAFFVTNSIEIAKNLTYLGKKNLLLGGNIKLNTDSIIGEECLENLKRFNFNKGFFGTNGITSKHGFTTPDTREATIKSFAISRTKDVYILADSDKFGKIYAVKFAEISEGIIVTENLAEDKVPNNAKIIDIQGNEKEKKI